MNNKFVKCFSDIHSLKAYVGKHFDEFKTDSKLLS